MATFVVRRIGMGVLVVAVLLSTIFLVGQTIGDPARLTLPVTASEDAIAERRAELGLDRPLTEQYVTFARSAAAGDFGPSMRFGRPALDVALSRLPATLYLTAATLLLAVPLAVIAGLRAAMRPRSWMSRAIDLLSTVSISAVDFWIGLLLIALFSVQLGWLPTSGYGGLQYVLLPALALAFRPFGRVSQVTRSAMATELRKGYVKTARSKGATERRAAYRHALRNAAIPLITLSGDEAIALLGGAVVVETIFAWPGLGQLLIESTLGRDLALMQATVFVMAVLVVATNIVVDSTYTFLDAQSAPE